MQEQPLFLEETRTPDRDHWRTPPELFARLDRIFRFGVDLAASPDNALCEEYLTEADDALANEWYKWDRWLWLNPPLSRLPEFMRKVDEQACNGAAVVALVPAHRCEQAWWHEHVLGQARWLVYPRGRVAYLPPPGVEVSSPAFPSVLCVYDANDEGRTTAMSLDEFERIHRR